MELICGTVKAVGKKNDVLRMFDTLWDFFDKELIAEKGSNDRYTIKFEFSSRIQSFMSYGDYFLPYSEEYNCHITAKMHLEDEDEDDAIILEYKKGKIIHGAAEYGFCDF